MRERASVSNRLRQNGTFFLVASRHPPSRKAPERRLRPLGHLLCCALGGFPRTAPGNRRTEASFVPFNRKTTRWRQDGKRSFAKRGGITQILKHHEHH